MDTPLPSNASFYSACISTRRVLTFTAIVGLAAVVQAQDTPATSASPAASASPAVTATTTSPASSASSAATASGTAPATTGRRGNGTARGAGSARGARGATPAPAIAPIARDKEPFTPNNFNAVKPELITLVIAGDSTAQTGTNAQRGWAALLVDYFDQSKINLVNPSIGGRSFRSFTYEGRWDQIVAKLKKGDIVFIQFGHNDGTGNDVANPNGRPELGGLGEETQDVTHADGKVETVHTFGWYARKYIKDVRDKGAIPIMMTTTVYNRWNADGSFARAGSNVNFARQVAEQEKVPLLDDTMIISDEYDKLGRAAVEPLFGDRILHTDTAGAIINAEMFVSGIKALDIKPLEDALNDKGKAISAYKPADPKAAKPAAPAATSAPAASTPAAASGTAK